MKVSTQLEQRIADRICEIADTDFKKFCRIAELLIRRVSRRQVKNLTTKNEAQNAK